MDRPEQFLPATDDGEETLVTPRFDAEETITARPVVPLGGTAQASAARRAWPLALVFISALLGGAISILGFRLYQQRQHAPAAMSPPPALTVAAPTPVPALEPSASIEPVTQETTSRVSDVAKTGIEKKTTKDEKKSAAEQLHKTVNADDRATLEAQRRNDEQLRHRARAEVRPRRAKEDADAQTSPDATPDIRNAPARDRAEQTDSVFETPQERRERRRAERRTRNQPRGADAIRDIFEGPSPP